MSVTIERPLSEIAAEIVRVWVKKDGTPNVYYAAAPYVEAMFALDKITEDYFADSARSVVRYFLANAATFRGEDAKRIKAELKAQLAAHPGY